MPELPDQTSVRAPIDECREIGEHEFLHRHANDRGPQSYYVMYEGKPYPLKAIWAAAHKPPISPRFFDTNVARREMQKLGFNEIVQLTPPAKNSK